MVALVEIKGNGNKRTTYVTDTGETFILEGDLSARANNPGNLSPTSKKWRQFYEETFGVIGYLPSSKGQPPVAVFPTPEAGRQAQLYLWSTPQYQNLTIKEAASKWATSPYPKQLAAAAGVSEDTLVKDLTPAQLSAMLNAQVKAEGSTQLKVYDADGNPVDQQTLQAFVHPIPPMGIPEASVGTKLDTGQISNLANVPVYKPASPPPLATSYGPGLSFPSGFGPRPDGLYLAPNYGNARPTVVTPAPVFTQPAPVYQPPTGFNPYNFGGVNDVTNSYGRYVPSTTAYPVRTGAVSLPIYPYAGVPSSYGASNAPLTRSISGAVQTAVAPPRPVNNMVPTAPVYQPPTGFNPYNFGGVNDVTNSYGRYVPGAPSGASTVTTETVRPGGSVSTSSGGSNQAGTVAIPSNVTPILSRPILPSPSFGYTPIGSIPAAKPISQYGNIPVYPPAMPPPVSYSFGGTPVGALPAAKKKALTGATGVGGGSYSMGTASGNYTVKPGETLSQIAARYGVSVNQLASASGITDPNRIAAGAKIVVPTNTANAGLKTTTSSGGGSSGGSSGGSTTTVVRTTTPTTTTSSGTGGTVKLASGSTAQTGTFTAANGYSYTIRADGSIFNNTTGRVTSPATK